MVSSGLILVRQKGKEKLYRLDISFRDELTNKIDTHYNNWVAILGVISSIYRIVDRAIEKEIPFTSISVLLQKEIDKRGYLCKISDEGSIYSFVESILYT